MSFCAAGGLDGAGEPRRLAATNLEGDSRFDPMLCPIRSASCRRLPFEFVRQAGQTERVILRKLAATDPEGKRHIIRLLSHFEFRGHLCLVFEPMVRCTGRSSRVAAFHFRVLVLPFSRCCRLRPAAVCAGASACTSCTSRRAQVNSPATCNQLSEIDAGHLLHLRPAPRYRTSFVCGKGAPPPAAALPLVFLPFHVNVQEALHSRPAPRTACARRWHHPPDNAAVHRKQDPC